VTHDEFDAYSDQYEAVLEGHLRPFGGDSTYLAEYKVALARRLILSEPASILDFGCGVGRSVGFLRVAFPKSRIVGADVSRESLMKARQSHPYAEFFHNGELATVRPFEMIFVANVFHHIPRERQLEEMRFCAHLLARGGHLIAFEHNPLNPVARYLFYRCPFDRGARLLGLRAMLRLVRAVGLRVVRWRYTLFFPPALQGLRKVEPYLCWVPLGGQYAVQAVREEP
jgi:SAM-dependent methyltransferase